MLAEDELRAAMDRLLQRGHAVTPQRRLVASALLRAPGPVSAQELAAALGTSAGIGQMTVYRTLTLLAEIGVAYQLAAAEPDRHEARYVFCSSDHHHHLICRACHTVVEVASCAMAEVDQDVAQRTGFQGVAHHLDFVGLCPQCAASDSGEAH